MLLIKNGRVIDPKSGFDQVADVLVKEKKIIRIAKKFGRRRCGNY
jgi:dihydroorotase (EC 3.5.2.3)